MARHCGICGYPKTQEFHKRTTFGLLCDMVTLSDDRIVARRRIEVGGDLHDSLGGDLKVKSRWIRDLKED